MCLCQVICIGRSACDQVSTFITGTIRGSGKRGFKQPFISYASAAPRFLQSSEHVPPASLICREISLTPVPTIRRGPGPTARKHVGASSAPTRICRQIRESGWPRRLNGQRELARRFRNQVRRQRLILKLQQPRVARKLKRHHPVLLVFSTLPSNSQVVS